VAGFVFGDVCLPFTIGRHDPDGAAVHRRLEHVQSMTGSGDTILDSSCRFFRLLPSRYVPVFAWTADLFRLGVFPSLVPDLVRTGCPLVYWDGMLEDHLPPSDKAFIRRNYLEIEPDVLVAGRRIATSPERPVDVEFDIELPRTYRASIDPRRDPGPPCRIDEREVTGSTALLLGVGRHRIEVRGQGVVAVTLSAALEGSRPAGNTTR
jgi:hypothetical protein